MDPGGCSSLIVLRHHPFVMLRRRPAADLEVIHEMARTNPKIVATPYPDLAGGAAVVATAWARQLTLDSVDDQRLEAFAAQYVDGSQAPEAGVTCSSSPLGTPIP